MKRLIVQSGIVLALVAAFPAIAAAQGEAEGESVDQLEPASASNPVPAATTQICWYGTRGDFVHLSYGQASGHGWWVNYNLPAGTRANVDVKLQVNFQGFLGLDWVDVTGWFSKDVYPGGGSGRRATARYTCTGTEWVEWRSVVDVDIIGFSDPANKLYTDPRWLRCSL